MPKFSFLQSLNEPLQQQWPWHLVGHIYFLLMLVMSVVWYQERMLAMDTAYYAFKVILRQDFYTGHERTISYLPQLLPLLVMKLGGSLKATLIAYSAGFILFYYAAYNVLVYLFRNPQAGLFLALALGLTLRYKFYGPVGEVVLSIVYLALLVGWMTKPAAQFDRLPAWLDVSIGLGLASLLITGHPFLTVSTAVALGFVLIYRKEWLNPRFWIISIYTGGLLLYTFVFVERNDYEAERADSLAEAWQVLSNYQDYYIFRVIYQYFDTQYLLPFVFFLLSLVLLGRANRYFSAIYLLLSSALVLTIIIVMHAYLNSNIFIMLDGYLVHLGLVWALPLAFYCGKEQKVWMFVSIGFLLGFSLTRIGDSKKFFQERLAYVQVALDEHTSPTHPKAVAYLEDLDYESLWIGWALGIETLMLSSLDGPQYSRTIYLANKREDLEGLLDEAELFLSVPFGATHVRIADLPSKYFQLPNIPYREIELK